ncbi:carbonic anhydrase 14 isoform X2 [Lutra lutra]|uniref:carbonic anhydrase 14 isoform X2 n=1 Tax=Lutra lutra TaxID=9657 RepID=UPI001FD50FD9|nr:carbonic anhydrase 14 isoform X2 [Lutra lutra]
MLFFTLLLEVIWILAAEGGQHWTYEGESRIQGLPLPLSHWDLFTCREDFFRVGPHGQDHWSASYPECGSNAQSPINIQTDSVTFDPELRPLQLHGYDQPSTEPLDLHNNGHTVKLSLPSTMYLEGLPRKYVAAQLHLHWGKTGSLGGSEHQINSEATAAELHIVHYDSDSYESLSEAAPKPQGLAVLGILIEVGETKNPVYEHILSHLHEIRHKDQKTSVPPFNVGELLPPRRDQFFRYNGSLTTPPCYQSVLWTVFNQRAQISVEQLKELHETLFSTEEEPSKLLVQNYRAPQPLNQRIVSASFIQVQSSYTTGEMLSLGVGILVGCLCLLLAVYFIARKIRKKRLGNRKSVVFTSAPATEA